MHTPKAGKAGHNCISLISFGTGKNQKQKQKRGDTFLMGLLKSSVNNPQGYGVL